MNDLVFAMQVMVFVFVLLAMYFASWPWLLAACVCLVAAALLWGLS